MAYGDTDRIYDELLVTLIRSGDRRAGERLAARWQPRLMRTAQRLLRNDEQARDAVQETWSGICRGWIGLSDPAKFPAWAFGILHRKCADRIRAEQGARASSASFSAASEPRIAARGEDRFAIDQAMSLLAPDQRTAAILYFGEGLTLREIAAVTGVPDGTAKSRIFHARRILKAALNGED